MHALLTLYLPVRVEFRVSEVWHEYTIPSHSLLYAPPDPQCRNIGFRVRVTPPSAVLVCNEELTSFYSFYEDSPSVGDTQLPEVGVEATVVEGESYAFECTRGEERELCLVAASQEQLESQVPDMAPLEVLGQVGAVRADYIGCVEKARR